MKQLSILKFEDMYHLKCGQFAYSIFNSDCPPIIKDRFKYANETNYALRSYNNPFRLHEPRITRKYHETFFSNCLPKIWNNIAQYFLLVN